jgi:hypothetical protein
MARSRHKLRPLESGHHWLVVSISAFNPKGTFIRASNSLVERRRRNDTSIPPHSTCGKVKALAVTFFI